MGAGEPVKRNAEQAPPERECRVLVYSPATRVFEFEYDFFVALWGKNVYKECGAWDFPKGQEFPTFSASQFVDALMWASRHGERVNERRRAQEQQGPARPGHKGGTSGA
jgi:hypothetical protein